MRDSNPRPSRPLGAVVAGPRDDDHASHRDASWIGSSASLAHVANCSGVSTTLHTPPRNRTKVAQKVLCGPLPLALGVDRLLPDRPEDVSPSGHLHDRFGQPVEVAHVVAASGAELAADREPEQVREDGSGLPLGLVALAFGRRRSSRTPFSGPECQ